MGIRRRNGFVDELSRNFNLYLMLLPALAGFFIFCYLPIYGLVIAFKRFDIILGFADSPWVGFKHFRSFFQDPLFFRTLRNTLLLGIFNLLWGFSPPILFALFLNEMRWFKLKKLYQTISYLPHFISTVVVVGMLMELTAPAGAISQILGLFGLHDIAFFNDPKYFRSLYISSGIWQGMGFASIIYLSTLSGVDVEQYESAYIDGASRLQRMRFITLPALMPTITVLLILNTASIINVGFEKVFLMQNPAIYETADVIQTYVYRRGISGYDFSYATAVGLFNSVVSFILVAGANKLSNLLNQNGIW